jgi:hypothetical protein
MSGKFRIGIVGLLVVGALAVAMTGTALAQDDPPAPETMPFHGRSFDRGMGGHAGLEIVAEMLGFETVEELTTELWGGTTLAELVEKTEGVELQDIQDAVTAAREDAMREGLEQAVEDGNMTREHADWLLQGLDNGFMGGRGFDKFGGMDGCSGRGGFRGPGGFGMPGRFQNAPPSADTNL